MESGIPKCSAQNATPPKVEASTSSPEKNSVEKSVNAFFMNNFYGAYLLNIAADVSFEIVRLFVMWLGGHLIVRWVSRAENDRERQNSDDLRTELQERRKLSERLESFLEKHFSSLADLAPTIATMYICTEIDDLNSTNPSEEDLAQGPVSGLPEQGSVHHKNECEVSMSEVHLDNDSNSTEITSIQKKSQPERQNDVTAKPREHESCSLKPNESILRRRPRFLNSTSAEEIHKPQVATSSTIPLESDSKSCKVAFIATFPTWSSADLFKKSLEAIQDKPPHVVIDICSSRIMQATMVVSKENLDDIRELAKEGMAIDKDFTLQLDRCLIYRRLPGKMDAELLRIPEESQVPIILRSEYLAGVLTIKGLHLEGSEIRAATVDGYVTLNPIRQEEPFESEFEVWKCTDRLPPSAKLKSIYVYAMKEVKVEGKEVIVRSEARHIDDVTTRIVLREWVPTAIGFLFVAVPLWRIVVPWIHSTAVSLQLTWLYPLLPALIVYFIHRLPTSTELILKNRFERVALALSSLYLGAFNTFNLRAAYVRKRINEQIPSNDACPPEEITGYLDDDTVFKGTSYRSQKRVTTTKGHERDEEVAATSPEESELDVVNTTEWRWPFYQKIRDLRTGAVSWRLQDLDDEDEGTNPFAVYYDGTNITRSQFTTLRIYSKSLLGILTELVPDQFKNQTESYSGILAKELFHVYVDDKLQKYSSGGPETSVASTKEIGHLTERQIHVSHLLRFLDQEFRTMIPRYLQIKREGRVPWDLLWTLFTRKEKVVYRCDLSSDEVLGEVISTNYIRANFERHGYVERDAFSILLSVWDYDCKNYRKYDKTINIEKYEWEKEITKISVYPLHYKLDPQTAEESFLTRGKKFYQLVMKTDHCFMQYKGLRFSSSRHGLQWRYSRESGHTHRDNADGRVMIDHRNFAKLKPDSEMGNAQPLFNLLVGEEVEQEASNLDTSLDPGSDPNLVFAPAIVYGYTFSLRQWGAFSVSGFVNIKFKSDAFESLVMEPDRKRMIFMLVNEYIKEPVAGNLQMPSIDPIANKGQGCIILCHGPPGTGKTLTAESIAEKLECPLWSMGAAELGTTPEALEKNLVQILEVAACWRAMLLLDEADVYLERRKDSTFSNLTQSALTGVFLRLLEYSSCVLFLTTNRMESVDAAISSRVSIFLEYKEFDIDHRTQVWRKFLKRANITDPSSDFLSKVAGVNFNGREIRNVVHNAQIVAKSKQETLTEDHVLFAMKIMGSSRVPEVRRTTEPFGTDTKSLQSMPVEESIDAAEFFSY